MASILEGRGYVVNDSNKLLDIFVDTAIRGLCGGLAVKIFTSLNPLGGAVFVVTAHLVNLATSNLFYTLFKDHFFGKVLRSAVIVTAASYASSSLKLLPTIPFGYIPIIALIATLTLTAFGSSL